MRIAALLGGRAAENIIFRDSSTGAHNDLSRATDIARRMITDFGFSERFRNMALTKRGASMMGQASESFLAREYSEDTQRYVDGVIARIIASRYAVVLGLLRSRRGLIDAMTALLLEKETVEEREFAELMATTPATEARRLVM